MQKTMIYRTFSAVIALTLLSTLGTAQPLNPTSRRNAAKSSNDFSWCGNVIHDHSKSKGLSNWATKQQQNSEKAKANKPFAKGATFSESEPNNTQQTADLFDLSSGSATVNGLRDVVFTPPTATTFTAAENNDSISTARPVGFQNNVTSSRRVNNVQIGNGLNGATTGDFDFYSFSADTGDLIIFDLTKTASSQLDSIIGIYDSAGNLLVVNDDESGSSRDSYLTWSPEAVGTYYLCVAGFSSQTTINNFPINPFQAGSGRGAGSVGNYDLIAYRLTPAVLSTEENGTISTANTIIATPNTAAQFLIEGEIGDSSLATGDFDFFRFEAGAGQSYLFDVTTSDPFATNTLDSVLGVFNPQGTLLAVNGDENGSTGPYDSLLTFTAPSAGTYYLAIGAQFLFSSNQLPLNFPNPLTGTGVSPASLGHYSLLISTNNDDPDWLSFNLVKGQVFSASGNGGLSGFGLIAPSGLELSYTLDNVNSFSASGSPFPVGDVSMSFVAPETGKYSLQLFTIDQFPLDENWDINLLVSKPGIRNKAAGTRQILFVDFNGATVNPNLFGEASSQRTLSPLSTFLPNWGLTANDESALITKILQVMEENLITDLAAQGENGNYTISGVNGEFALTILNSRDHADPFGQPNVSKMIIGGTISELGISTIGIAESIDPGNYANEETAVVLLDLLAAASTDPNSLNQYSLSGGRTKIDLVGVGIGNIASHEAGHFFGNWHTVNSNSFPNIMDQGGDLNNSIGVGPDSIFGNANDVDVDFITDEYEPGEVYFIGFENTTKATAFGLSTGGDPVVTNQRNLWMAY